MQADYCNEPGETSMNRMELTKPLLGVLFAWCFLLVGGCQSLAPTFGGETNYDAEQHAAMVDDCMDQYGNYILVTIISQKNRDGIDEIVDYQCFPSSKETIEKMLANDVEFVTYEDGVKH